MNLDIILGIARHLLTAFGGVLVTKGITDAATVDTAAGAIITLAGFGWSVAAKWRARSKANE
jgi:hypothetical protein